MSRIFNYVHVQQEPDPYSAFNSNFRTLFESGDPSLPPWTPLVAQFVPKRFYITLRLLSSSRRLSCIIHYSGENTTVLEFKQIIQTVFPGCPSIEFQKLSLLKRSASAPRKPPSLLGLKDDEQTLAHYDVQNGDVIFLFLRLSGGTLLSGPRRSPRLRAIRRAQREVRGEPPVQEQHHNFTRVG